jgi:hypothetical protein
MRKLLFTILLLVVPTFAQTPTQVKAGFLQFHTSYSVTLDQPTVEGQAIILYFYGGGAQWEPSPTCALANYAEEAATKGGLWCNYNLYDSQGNQFIQVNKDFPKFVYVPASKGGVETITISFAGPCCENLAFAAMVFPVTLVLKDVVPPLCNFLPQSGQNQICNPWNGSSGSVNNSDNTSTPESHTLTSSIPNELFIGLGDRSNQVVSTLTPINGWAAPIGAPGSEVFLSYKTSGSTGTQETFSLLATPALSEQQYVYMGIQGFKAIPIQ